MTTQSADRTGIVAALTSCLARHDGFINALSQFGTPGSERFFSRIDFSIDKTRLGDFKSDLQSDINLFDLTVDIIPKDRPTKTLIMVSKFDHCLADLLYRRRSGTLNIEIVGIVSNHEDARPLAKTDNIPFHHVPVTKSNKPEAEAQLRKIMKDTDTELVILARYMQILSDSFCSDFKGRIINIHHSFLPSFKGAKPYHKAYDRGVKLIGATAHYVTKDLDEGPIIDQSVQRVDHTMTPNELVKLGRDVEAQTLARAIAAHTDHRAFINGIKTVILP